MVGTISIVYDHHTGDLNDRLIKLQHDYFSEISSTTHIHLDYDNCLEVIIVKGRSSKVRVLGEKLMALKGVKHGRIFITQSKV